MHTDGKENTLTERVVGTRFVHPQHPQVGLPLPILLKFAHVQAHVGQKFNVHCRMEHQQVVQAERLSKLPPQVTALPAYLVRPLKPPPVGMQQWPMRLAEQ